MELVLRMELSQVYNQLQGNMVSIQDSLSLLLGGVRNDDLMCLYF